VREDSGSGSRGFLSSEQPRSSRATTSTTFESRQTPKQTVIARPPNTDMLDPVCGLIKRARGARGGSEAENDGKLGCGGVERSFVVAVVSSSEGNKNIVQLLPPDELRSGRRLYHDVCSPASALVERVEEQESEGMICELAGFVGFRNEGRRTKKKEKKCEEKYRRSCNKTVFVTRQTTFASQISFFPLFFKKPAKQQTRKQKTAIMSLSLYDPFGTSSSLMDPFGLFMGAPTSRGGGRGAGGGALTTTTSSFVRPMMLDVKGTL